MNNNWYKKEKPLLGLTGLGGGVDGLSVVGAASKTYVDDVFSTYLYEGNGSAGKVITNNIDLSTKGGMVWTKQRSGAMGSYPYLADTVRGITNYLIPSETSASADDSNRFTSVSSTGFTIGNEADINTNAATYASWTFAKQKGFCDIVTYTGDGVNGRTVSHSLGSVPGMILVKNLSDTDSWAVYHRDLGNTKALNLNLNSAAVASANYWYNTSPTSTEFTLGYGGETNGNGYNYVAYVFAGGESTAATATSVYTESSGYLGLDQSTDFDLGTSDFTIEAWVRPRTGDRSGSTFNILSFGYPFNLYYVADASVPYSGKFTWDGSTSNSTNNQTMGGYTPANSVEQNQWNHVALTRSGSTFKFFLNGTLKHTDTSSSAFGTNAVHGCKIGYGTPAGSQYFQGDVSNVRYVLGTALYTDSFKVPTEPLSNVTNTKLLCCQGSATDSATVSPGTITPYNSPSWKAYSPFDDSDGFKFGADEDQNIIKCSSYIGNASADGPEINLGWEPQWILLKRVAGGSGNWTLLDCMRGIVTAGNDMMLKPNSNDGETTSNDYIELTPRGFRVKATYDQVNASGDTYIYIAIRRPDGYVGKPPSAGTGVFAMDTGNGSSTIPNFDSGFPVDFALVKKPAVNVDWYTGSRLTSGSFMYTNANSAEGTSSEFVFDSNLGWMKGTGNDSSYQSWMWKRGQGFDAVAYTGNGTAGHQIRHSLSKSPEMIWVKDRENTRDWRVFHHGLNGGSNPAQYGIKINSYDVESQNSSYWNDTAPTSTSFTIGTSNNTNNSSTDYIAMLFASVDSISKVGYYSGSSSQQTISTGFQPRFVIIRRVNDQQDWVVLDTLRGWVQSTNDPRLELNYSTAQNANTDFGYPTTGGFVLEGNLTKSNENGGDYIYYAHA